MSPHAGYFLHEAQTGMFDAVRGFYSEKETGQSIATLACFCKQTLSKGKMMFFETLKKLL
jgi:hypothetical protein